jgi:hypothetical protein
MQMSSDVGDGTLLGKRINPTRSSALVILYPSDVSCFAMAQWLMITPGMDVVWYVRTTQLGAKVWALSEVTRESDGVR